MNFKSYDALKEKYDIVMDLKNMLQSNKEHMKLKSFFFIYVSILEETTEKFPYDNRTGLLVRKLTYSFSAYRQLT